MSLFTNSYLFFLYYIFRTLRDSVLRHPIKAIGGFYSYRIHNVVAYDKTVAQEFKDKRNHAFFELNNLSILT